MMVALHYGSFDFTLGWTFGLKAFIAAILGGIGNIPGAMLGGHAAGRHREPGLPATSHRSGRTSSPTCFWR